MLDNISQIAINNGGSLTPLIIPSELTDGTGLCNVSLFMDGDELLANIRHVHYTLYHSEFNQKFYCKWGVLAYLNPEDDMTFHYIKWTNPLEIIKVNTKDKSTEKVQEGILPTISCDTVITKKEKLELPWDLRGGSNVIKVDNQYMCITHEVDFWHHPGHFKDAFYYHRIVIWDKDWNLVRVSKQFQYMGTRIEFTCGLALDGDDLLISFGYQDNASYIMRWPKPLLEKLEWEDLNKIRK